MLRRMRFELKSLFGLIALFAVYLAWRVHDPEAQAVSAIHQAGGKTYYGYQEQWMGSSGGISVGQLPDCVYFSQNDIVCSGTQTPPTALCQNKIADENWISSARMWRSRWPRECAIWPSSERKSTDGGELGNACAASSAGKAYAAPRDCQADVRCSA